MAIGLDEKFKYLAEKITKKRDMLKDCDSSEYGIGKVSALNYVLREISIMTYQDMDDSFLAV